MVEGISRLSRSTAVSMAFSAVLSVINVRAIAIAGFIVPLLLPLSLSMRLGTGTSMCASELWAKFCWIQIARQNLIRQSPATERFPAKVTLERAAKRAACLGTVPRQRNGSPPPPRAQRHMTRKLDGMKAPVVRHKTIQRRQAEIGVVGDGFHRREFDSSRPRPQGHSRRFHVHRTRAVCFLQPSLLFLAGHGLGAHQYSLTRADFCPDTIGGVDHRARRQNIPHMQGPVERSSKADGDRPRGFNFPNHRLGSATRGFRSDPAAYQSCFEIFKKTISSSAVLDRPDLPASDERSHLAFHGGDDGDPRHIRYHGTNPPTGAKPHRLQASASPVPVPLSLNSQTSSCVPCVRRQWSRAAPGPKSGPSPSHPRLPTPTQRSKAASRLEMAIP